MYQKKLLDICNNGNKAGNIDVIKSDYNKTGNKGVMDEFQFKAHSRDLFYNQIKSFNGVKYSGMRVGGRHSWIYNKGIWDEVKVRPDKWKIHYESVKTRRHRAPVNSGAEIGSAYHWFILADQKAYKLDENSYQTVMDGVKFKVGHKRPHWRSWSYENPSYASYVPYKEHIIQILEEILAELRAA